MFSHVQFYLIPNHCHFQGITITTCKHWVGSSGFLIRVRKARDPNQSNNEGSFWNCSVYTQNRAYMQTTEWKWLPQLVFWHLRLAPSTCISFYLKTNKIFSPVWHTIHTCIRCKRPPKTHLFKNALQSGDFWADAGFSFTCGRTKT